MLEERDDTRSLVRDQAIAYEDCDVPAGWSLDEWRTVRGLAREIIREPAKPWWRRPPRASRRSRAAADAR
jgi:hypothetical protein